LGGEVFAFYRYVTALVYNYLDQRFKTILEK